MKKVFLTIVITTVIFAAVSCKSSKNASNDRRSKQEQLDSDQRKFRKIFNEEMKR